jgi:glycosyl transferase family 2
VARSRNFGAAIVESDLLAFVDSDCVLLPGWYEAVMRCFSQEGVAAAGCRYELRDRPTWVERSWLAAKGGPAPALVRDTRYVPGGNLVVRREAFAQVGGFDEAVETGEDMELCAAIAAHGHRVVECGTVRSQHLGEPRTLADVFWRNRWHGRGARLRYADGRLAAITLSTIAFAGTAAAGVTGLAVSVALRRWAPAAPLAVTPVIPALYAARYTRMQGVSGFVRLWLIYFAYFCGRSAALPDVVRRRWAEVRHQPIDPLRASTRPSRRHAGLPTAGAAGANQTAERLRDTKSEMR